MTPDPDDPVSNARAEVIDAIERSAEVYGFNRSYGRLYGILFFEDDPVSLDQLAAESGYAKSTVSTAMQKMARLHFVDRRSLPGEGKKAYYEAERDLWQVLQQLLKHEGRREIEIMTEALETAEQRLEAADSERAAQDLQKVRSLQTLYHRFDQIVEILTSRSLDRIVDFLNRLT